MLYAHFVAKLKGFNGDARLYRLNQPVIRLRNEYQSALIYDHIIISAAVIPYSGPETFVFPADKEGNVTKFEELGGSFRGELDHDEALKGFLETQNRK